MYIYIYIIKIILIKIREHPETPEKSNSEKGADPPSPLPN